MGSGANGRKKILVRSTRLLRKVCVCFVRTVRLSESVMKREREKSAYGETWRGTLTEWKKEKEEKNEDKWKREKDD